MINTQHWLGMAHMDKYLPTYQTLIKSYRRKMSCWVNPLLYSNKYDYLLLLQLMWSSDAAVCLPCSILFLVARSDLNLGKSNGVQYKYICGIYRSIHYLYLLDSVQGCWKLVSKPSTSGSVTWFNLKNQYNEAFVSVYLIFLLYLFLIFLLLLMWPIIWHPLRLVHMILFRETVQLSRQPH